LKHGVVCASKRSQYAWHGVQVLAWPVAIPPKMRTNSRDLG